MNWRKGFFRAWVVFTVLWVMAVSAGAYVYGGWKTYHDASRELAKVNKFESASKAEKAEMRIKDPWIGVTYRAIFDCGSETLTQCVISSRKRMWAGLKISGAIAVAVPAALLALGATLAWVFKGFRQSKDNARS